MTRLINSRAPIRICDLGGWTDTWFAGYGNVLNIAVHPLVQCQIQVRGGSEREGRVMIVAENFGDRYLVDRESGTYGKHPLLEAAIEAMTVPRDLDLEIYLYSDAPPGGSTGTSASVAVALIGALDLLTPERMTPLQVAAKAHQIETEYLGLQSGIQDQIAAACGGICYLEMEHYPEARVTPISLPDETWWELETRLSLIYIGRSHNSSAVHEKVIAELKKEGPNCTRLNALRDFPVRGRNALEAGDLAAFGQAMIENTRAQAALHPSLVSDLAGDIIDIANRHGALGWKVNGAGGEGGSLTLLNNGSQSGRRAMVQDILALDQSIREIPITLCRHGLLVWETALQ